jgi:hypothetical protein
MYFPGFSKYTNMCFSDQTNPAPFKALLAGKLVLPVGLPITPPSLGPADPLSSPYNHIIIYGKCVASGAVIVEN